MDLQQKISELRENFLKHLEDTPECDFHIDDINRVKSGDDWLRRFLEHNEFNIVESFNMLLSTCEWRKKVGANDISENDVKREYLEDGVCFGYGRDKDGKALFVIKSKLHVKGARDFAELQRCVIYWFERLEREGNGEQISLFFDMCEAGISNLDMEFTKYLINLFKLYYPNFLNYIILLDLPWVLNAALKIIKSWLPAKAIPKIKQVNKNTLKDYVDPNVALKCWGGNNDYTFTFVPEVRSNNNNNINNNISNCNRKLENNKKVHFAAGSSPMTEQSLTPFNEQNLTEELSMLSINPTVIIFNKEGQEIIGTLNLKNQTDKYLSYKIKTTAPEKFRVRRSTGTLSPDKQVTITVSLQPGFNLRTLLSNDKFLVMCLPMKDAKMSNEELSEFWKTNGKSAEQHRVFCQSDVWSHDAIVEPTSILSSNSANTDRKTESLYLKINHLEECHSKMHKELRTLKHVMIVSIVWSVVAVIAIVYIIRYDISQIANNVQSCHMHRGNY